MNQSHFYFQGLLDTALNGINSGGITHSMKYVGSGILVLTVLYQIYNVWWRDGDYHELGSVLVKAMLMTTLFASYDTVFRLLVDAFNGVADIVYSHTPGANDMVAQWLKDVGSHWQFNSLKDIWDTLRGGIAAVVNMVLLFVTYLVLPEAYVIFSFLYMVCGVVLYGLGQMVLALYPSGALGVHAQTYVRSLLTWGLWPVLYALFADCMHLVQADSVQNVLNQQSFLGGFVGLGSSILLGLAGIVFALAIAAIPMIAHQLVSGSVGQALSGMVRGAIKKGGGGM